MRCFALVVLSAAVCLAAPPERSRVRRGGCDEARLAKEASVQAARGAEAKAKADLEKAEQALKQAGR